MAFYNTLKPLPWWSPLHIIAFGKMFRDGTQSRYGIPGILYEFFCAGLRWIVIQLTSSMFAECQLAAAYPQRPSLYRNSVGASFNNGTSVCLPSAAKCWSSRFYQYLHRLRFSPALQDIPMKTNQPCFRRLFPLFQNPPGEEVRKQTNPGVFV